MGLKFSSLQKTVNDENLEVCSVDMCFNINGLNHHTSRFDLMTRQDKPHLVVRRGQPFQLTLTLNRPYKPTTDQITFTLELAGVNRPWFGDGTSVCTPLTVGPSDIEDKWTAVYNSSLNNCVVVEITPPAHCVVGIWNLKVYTQQNDGEETNSFNPDSIYILFNPWCTNDQLYLPGEEKRQEYVLADSGKIWKGSSTCMQPVAWIYGQFEKDILDCALFLVTGIGKVHRINCNNPIIVSRALTSALNNRQKEDCDRGVLADSWDEKEWNENNPNNWAGSTKILQTFYHNCYPHNEKRNGSRDSPVQYGQCWVFAGLYTTAVGFTEAWKLCRQKRIAGKMRSLYEKKTLPLTHYQNETSKLMGVQEYMRALGIPCRPVTAYESARPTNGNLTINEYYDEQGHFMEDICGEFVWTFHVWNEVWMKRPDLSDMCDGWNAVDATPQAKSDNVFQCGPASVKAIQRGDIHKVYDTLFVIGAVNSEKWFWKRSGSLDKILKTEEHAIGLSISTKAVGSWDREDITQSYKQENMPSDVAEVQKRILDTYSLNKHSNPITVKIVFNDDFVIGSPFSVTAVITNDTNNDMEVTALMRVNAMPYNGRLGDEVAKDRKIFTLSKSSDPEFNLNVTYEDYYKSLVDQCNFSVVCCVRANECGFETIAKETFRLRVPEVIFKVEGIPTVGKELTVTASFTNPLPENIRNGRYHFEGAGLEHDQEMCLVQYETEPNAEAKVTLKITPRIMGMTVLSAKFFSNQLKGVEGLRELLVQ